MTLLFDLVTLRPPKLRDVKCRPFLLESFILHAVRFGETYSTYICLLLSCTELFFGGGSQGENHLCMTLRCPEIAFFALL